MQVDNGDRDGDGGSNGRLAVERKAAGGDARAVP